MKIGYLVSQYPAPSHTFIRREVAALRRRGLQVETFSIHPGEALSPEDEAEASRTFRVLPTSPLSLAASTLTRLARHPGRSLDALRTVMQLRLPGGRNLVRAAAYFVEAMRLADALERAGVGHLHNHFANASSHVGLAAARHLGIGWSTTLHGFADFESEFTPRLGAKIAAASFVATATRFGRDLAAASVGPDLAKRLHVVRCGIEVARLPSVARRPLAPGEPLVLLSVGRLSPEKGQVGLVEAFSEAIRSGLDARLVLLGGGPEEARIREAARERGVADRVELRGRQPESVVLEAMASAHVFVLSSLSEGLPVVLMEALAMELPVIAPAISGIPELVTDGETGLLFPAGKWDLLAERILAMARDGSGRARMAAAGRRRVLDEYDVDRAAAPLARLLAECLQRPGVPVVPGSEGTAPGV